MSTSAQQPNAYDGMFDTMTLSQLWEALATCEAEYQRRHHAAMTAAHAVGEVHSLISEGLAEFRTLNAAAVEQGEMLSAINRQIGHRMTHDTPVLLQCDQCHTPAMVMANGTIVHKDGADAAVCSILHGGPFPGDEAPDA